MVSVAVSPRRGPRACTEAVCDLRRRSVGFGRSRSLAALSSLVRAVRRAGAGHGRPPPAGAGFGPARRSSGGTMKWPQGRPGRASSPTGCRSPRESAARLRWFRPAPARSSPGLFALQGVPPHRGASGFPGAPLLGFSARDVSGPRRGPSGSRPRRGWLVSRETADPPGLLRLLVITGVRIGRGSGVSSSDSGVRRRPLPNPPRTAGRLSCLGRPS
jgi:hypothetical protein